MAFMFGLLIGSIFCGILSDRFGRKRTLILMILLAFGSSLGGSFVRNYWAYLFLR